MDIYTITARLGKDPDDKGHRANVGHLLRRHNIYPVRHGWYEDAIVTEFIARHLRGETDRRWKKNKQPPTL